MRRLLLLTLLANALLCATASAEPQRDFVAPDLNQTLVSAHVVVHFTTTGDNAVAAGRPKVVSDAAERAYAVLTGWGYPVPDDDGDGHVDVYVQAQDYPGLTRRDPASTLHSSATVTLAPAATNVRTTSHEMFHVFQAAIGRGQPQWINEALANWGSSNVNLTNGGSQFFDHPQTSLDCVSGGIDDRTSCDGDRGYHRWVFFEALSERLGRPIILELLQEITRRRAADGNGHGLDAIRAVLAAHSFTLDDALADLGARMAAGTFAIPGLGDAKPALTGPVNEIIAGTAAPEQALSINHLAFGFTGYSGVGDACDVATLTLIVQGAPGVPFRAVFGRRDTHEVTSLAAQGDRAVAAVPWATCATAGGYLAVTSTGPTDGESFVVNARVDPGVVPAPTPAPAVVPTLSELKAPRTVTRRRGRAATLRFSVRADAAGTLVARLRDGRGDGPMVRLALRPGLNIGRIRIPGSLMSKRLTLRLTPASVDGAAGTAVTQHVNLERRGR